MSRTGQARRSAAAARLLGLLALVLGLVGMHGSADSHHAAATPALSTVAAVGTDTPALSQGRAATHRLEHGASGAPAGAAAPAGLSGGGVLRPSPQCSDDCPDGLGVLCAAVIGAAAATALVVAAARRRAVTAPADGGPQPRAPAAARRLRPGVDPVAELCVSRT